MEETAQVNNPQQVSETIQTPVVNPVPVQLEEKPKKSSGLALILSFTTIIATLIAGFFYFQNMQLRSELQKNLPSSTPTPIATPDETADWKTYTEVNYKFSFRYPKDIELNKNECISLRIVGPTQTGETEPFDGLYLNFCPKTLEDQTIDQWIEKDLSGGGEITTPKTKISLNAYTAYTYELTGELRQKNIVIQSPISKTQIILITDITQDPTNQGYEKLVNQILATFKFNEENKISCVSPRPEVCTEECIANPPFICGSDGKSYCTTCQACANKNVEWYEIKETSCEEK